MNELALFAGIGGGILGGKLLGWRTVCAVERDAYAASVLAQRQNDGHLEPFPIWSDVSTFDGKPWRGIIDVVSGGFPCQDISCAGRGEGINGARSGLWGEMARIICEVQPRYVLVENSPALAFRGLGRVLGDLAKMGFDAQWGVLGSDSTGNPHHRARMWLVACPNKGGFSLLSAHRKRRKKQEAYRAWADTHSPRGIRTCPVGGFRTDSGKPAILRGDNESTGFVDRFAAIGNAQDAGLVKLAWNTLAP